MSINIFEGARRITYLVMAIILLAGIYLAFDSTPSLQLSYSISIPGGTPTKDEVANCNYPDSERSDYRTTPKGHSFTLHICFRSMSFDNGKVLIPYKMDSNNGLIWGDDKYSDVVMGYENVVLEAFRIPTKDMDSLDMSYHAAKAREAFRVLGITLMVILSFWCICWVAGWIIRGFAGIKMGKDFKE